MILAKYKDPQNKTHVVTLLARGVVPGSLVVYSHDEKKLLQIDERCGEGELRLTDIRRVQDPEPAEYII